ncbi:NADH dehydrogenase [Microbacterium barkeri]|uniref:NADH dehydrogenase n=1 Tax=Microbacterium barkeri TaxID=33917 RepID=A0A9W6H570_9MICO|nr:FAD-dependent oxidoreductase [Microbacterium barkeri]MDR6877560.1 NADH dehydrogenase FAD-containing subunit [Microbacterium barkeri]GLJ62497.1 NADH dehydrogenase [Microbacterium barkeri]
MGNVTGRRTEVVVIGGGYAGVLAANRLTRRDDVAVTLVNARDRFVERVRLHQLVGGSDDAVVDFGDLLAKRVRLVVDTVTEIDAPRRRLVLEKGEPLAYDYLVYAVGSTSGPLEMPGAAEHALPLATLEEAERVRAALGSAPVDAPLVVVGSGPLGIETAAELAELGRRVTLVCGRVLSPYSHESARRTIRRRLESLGVRLLEGTTAVRVTRASVELADGRSMPSAVTIWTAGFAAADLARRSGLSTDADGRLLADETLTSIDDDRIVATGDAASPQGVPLRMSCQAALPLGSHAADTVLQRIAGGTPAGFDRGIAAMCVSLGRRFGVFQFARFDDTAIRLHVPGRLGALLKEEACKSPISQIRAEARRPGTHRWPVKDGRRAERVRAAADGAGRLRESGERPAASAA